MAGFWILVRVLCTSLWHLIIDDLKTIPNSPCEWHLTPNPGGQLLVGVEIYAA